MLIINVVHKFMTRQNLYAFLWLFRQSGLNLFYQFHVINVDL
jgi:hypothetical protein